MGELIATRRSATPVFTPPTGSSTTASSVLALMCGVGGLAVVLGATARLASGAPAGLLQLLGTGEILVAALVTLARPRMTTGKLYAAIGVRVAITAVLAAYAAAPMGVALVGVRCIGVAAFTACFISRRGARWIATLMLCGYGAGVLVNRPAHFALLWLVVSAATITAMEAFGRLVAQLRALAARDPLTGLANRTTFRDAAVREIALAERGRAPLSLLLLDLDDFKAVNDTRGHLAGDALLVELARSWQAELRRSDLLARVGGDEFAILLPTTTQAEAEIVLAKLRLAHPAAWSAGTSTWTAGASIDGMLRSADRQLYDSKDRRPRRIA